MFHCCFIDVLSGVSSGVLSGVSSGVSFGVSSGVSSGVSFDTSFGVLPESLFNQVDIPFHTIIKPHDIAMPGFSQERLPGEVPGL